MHTNAPSFVFKVPLMIDRKVEPHVGGYFFDKRLTWTEDFDLTQRVHARGVPVRRLRDAVVIHEPLNPAEDLRKAMSYGAGHRQGVRLGLPGYRRLRPGGLTQLPGLARRVGPLTAMYALAFNFATAMGYAAEQIREGMSRDRD